MAASNPVLSPRGPPSPCSGSYLDTDGGQRQPPCIPSPTEVFHTGDAGGAVRGRPDTPRARASSRRPGHPTPPSRGPRPSPFLQGMPRRLGCARTRLSRSPRPSHRVAFPQGCGGAACPPPAYRLPQSPRLRARPGLPRERIPCCRSASPCWRLRSDQ